MARSLRIEHPGAVYHITSRGNARADIFLSNADRKTFLDLLAATVGKYNWLCHAYCLLGNHYHAIIETPDPNLPPGMRQLSGVYTEPCKRAHQRVGHVFQGRHSESIHCQCYTDACSSAQGKGLEKMHNLCEAFGAYNWRKEIRWYGKC